jgi:4,5-DOPA dioxygenase extradiol
MNAIEQNAFTMAWQALGKTVNPKAILMVSAHWFTRGTWTQDEAHPKVINDMYGFPKPLYEVNYQVEGDAMLTQQVKRCLGDIVDINNGWGIDHGAWSVLVHMFPKRDVPVVQLSIDAQKTPEAHFEIGRKLSALRDDGYLIMGSGNIVHNLRKVDFHRGDGEAWADAFDLKIRDAILAGDYETCVQYKQFGELAALAVPTTDHYDPLLYCLGAARSDDMVEVFNDARVMGSLSMTGYVFKEKV